MLDYPTNTEMCGPIFKALQAVIVSYRGELQGGWRKPTEKCICTVWMHVCIVNFCSKFSKFDQVYVVFLLETF